MAPALVSLALCAALAVVYALRPDGAAAVTVFPVWAWLLPGLLVAAAGWTKPRWALLAALAWVLYLGALAEEPGSLWRGRTTAPVPGPGGLRVVTLNCAGGSEAAAGEVVAYHPDVVLLQEAPARAAVARLGRTLYGPAATVVWSPDAALLCRGPAQPVALPRDLDFAVAARRHDPGGESLLVSLRLTPPLVRLDLWNPVCWRDQAANRRLRREQVAALAQWLRRQPDTAVVVGGDFNAPGRDGAVRPLRSLLRDAFPAAGRGWPNTHMSDLPLWRIDQIWTSTALQPLTLRADATRNSDHRLLACDLVRR